MNAIDQSIEWKELVSHREEISELKIKEQFISNPKRFENFSLGAANIFLDYSKNHITNRTMDLLFALATRANLVEQRERMFRGEKINFTEQRAAWHVMLRNFDNVPNEISSVVRQELNRIAVLVKSIHDGKWRGYSGKHITDVVHIGIGGSDLGPAMVVQALKPYHTPLHVHFVSNLDATDIVDTLIPLNHETTLFLIASKTFTTQETIANALAAKNWLLGRIIDSGEKVMEKHFIGITANPTKAVEFGIAAENIFPFWDWVGGRFSLWSSIGIAIALATGMQNFYELLSGAQEMDMHFKTASMERNLPIILALLGIWNINFLETSSNAIVPYDQSLRLFPSYLQQLEMESNGKNINIEGTSIAYKTAPVIWGAVGTNSQHSFHQLLMQGTSLIPVDFIVPLSSHHPLENHHLMLYANCLAQSQALMLGRSEKELVGQLAAQTNEAPLLAKHQAISGNVPSNTIVLKQISPRTLGSLIALYEHKVFVQGVIWQINSFDQWGVELGKKLASKLIPVLRNDNTNEELDSSTKGLIDLYKKTVANLQNI